MSLISARHGPFLNNVLPAMTAKGRANSAHTGIDSRLKKLWSRFRVEGSRSDACYWRARPSRSMLADMARRFAISIAILAVGRQPPLGAAQRSETRRPASFLMMKPQTSAASCRSQTAGGKKIIHRPHRRRRAVEKFSRLPAVMDRWIAAYQELRQEHSGADLLLLSGFRPPRPVSAPSGLRPHGAGDEFEIMSVNSRRRAGQSRLSAALPLRTPPACCRHGHPCGLCAPPEDGEGQWVETSLFRGALSEPIGSRRAIALANRRFSGPWAFGPSLNAP